MKKYILIVLVILSCKFYCQPLEADRARGLFLTLSLGPRFPVADFGTSQSLGIGINLGLTYTDNEYLPLFFYGRIGWEHYPGSIDFYRRSDYSAIATNVIPFNAGVRLYLPPMLEDIVLLIPVIEFGGSFAIIEKSHQFKIDSGRENFLEETSKGGFHVGWVFQCSLLK